MRKQTPHHLLLLTCRYATNGYNALPPRPHKKGTFFTQPCSRCKRRVYTGLESFAVERRVHSHGGETQRTVCYVCAGIPEVGPPQQPTRLGDVQTMQDTTTDGTKTAHVMSASFVPPPGYTGPR